MLLSGFGVCMYVCMCVCMVVTAVLKAVSLSGGHTVASELPTSMGIKQSSSLRLTMCVCMYVLGFGVVLGLGVVTGGCCHRGCCSC